jgi:hypothetical protein
MKLSCFNVLAVWLVSCAGTLASGATIIPTNLGPLGADAELRDEAPGTNRGANFELATRIANNGTVAGGNDGGDRGSEMYLRFDIRNVTPAMLNAPITLRMHYGRNGITAARTSDPPAPGGVPTKFVTIDYRGLKPSLSDGWTEAGITYLNAPGLTSDGEQGTRDYNSDLSLLGSASLPGVFPQSHLPVGGSLDFVNAPGSALHTLIANSLGVVNSVTIVAAVNHSGVTGVDPSSWVNFNYVFIPKEVTILNNTLGQPNQLNDTGYQPDVTVVPLPSPAPGSPFLNMSNANGEFSPKLIFADPVVPEPASVAIATLGALAMGAGLRRKAS